MKLQKIVGAVCLCISGLFMAGCADDDVFSSVGEDSGGYAHITLYLNMADAAASRSYQDSPLDYDTEGQRTIDAGDVYAILYDSYTGEIIGIPELTKMEENTSSVLTLNATVKIPDAPVKTRILANVSHAGSFGSTPDAVRKELEKYIGKSDEDLYKALRANGFNEDGKWPSDTLLPMQSAMSGEMPLTSDTWISAYLYRSIAKVGVVYDNTVYDADGNPEKDSDGNNLTYKTSLVGVRVINQHEYGAFVSEHTPDTDIQKQFTQPYIQESTPIRTTAVEYTVSNNINVEEIFVPEHKNTGNITSDIYLQVGFKEPGKSETQWYDVYFTENPLDNTSDSYDIIRNHSYIFKIKRYTDDLVVDLEPYTVIDLEPEFGLERDDDGNLVSSEVKKDENGNSMRKYFYASETLNLVKIEYYKTDDASSDKWKIYEEWKISYAFADIIDKTYDHVVIYKYKVDGSDETLYEIANISGWMWNNQSSKFVDGHATDVWEYKDGSQNTTRGFQLTYDSDNTLTKLIVTEYEYYPSGAIKTVTTSVYSGDGVGSFNISGDRDAQLKTLEASSTTSDTFTEDTGES